MKSTLRVIGNLSFGLLVCGGIISLILLYQIQTKPEQIPSFFGFKVMNVVSGSMEPEIGTGSYLIIKETNPDQIEVGDIITYQLDDTYVTHRVSEIQQHSETVHYMTKGDANNVVDEKMVTESQLEGRYIAHIPQIGTILQNIQGQLGVFVIIITSLLCIAVYVIKKFLLPSKNDNNNSKLHNDV